MSSEAYLIMFVDTTRQHPRITGAGIFSEGAGSLTTDLRRAFPVDITSMSGPDYDTAYRYLVNHLRSSPLYAWILPLVPELR